MFGIFFYGGVWHAFDDLQDSVWHEQAVRDREEMILKDQEEARKRIKEAKEAAAFQKAQYAVCFLSHRHAQP